MKNYLVASSGKTLDSKVSGRFGHANYFMLIDPKTREYEVLHGIQADESGLNTTRFIPHPIKKVIVGNIGPSSFNELISSGYTLYLCRNMSVEQAVNEVENGHVEPLEHPTLKDSIHSARRKTGDAFKGHGTGRGMGRRMGGGRRGSFRE